MHRLSSRLRSAIDPRDRHAAAVADGDADACAWDAMRATYEEQAARGVAEAITGLERIEAGLWPTSGDPRHGAND